MSDKISKHARLMDRTYRFQRHVYDLTRKYYLLGRDDLINSLQPQANNRVVEIGCGTGRNLIAAAKKYPTTQFFGLDISHEMLITARKSISNAGLEHRIKVAQADAADFSLPDLFGFDNADRIFYSYTLSMILPWQAAIEQGFLVLADNGSLHIVDFGKQEGLPNWCQKVLFRWLALFHVEPRLDLLSTAQRLAKKYQRETESWKSYRGYAVSFCAR